MSFRIIGMIISFGMSIMTFKYGTRKFYETKGDEGWNHVTLSALSFITGVLFLLEIVEMVVY